MCQRAKGQRRTAASAPAVATRLSVRNWTALQPLLCAPIEKYGRDRMRMKANNSLHPPEGGAKRAEVSACVSTIELFHRGGEFLPSPPPHLCRFPDQNRKTREDIELSLQVLRRCEYCSVYCVHTCRDALAGLQVPHNEQAVKAREWLTPTVDEDRGWVRVDRFTISSG